jgi:hypothetical protein
MQNYTAILSDFGNTMGTLIGEGLADKTEEGAKKMGKAMLIAAITALEQVLDVYLAESLIASIAKHGPVLGSVYGALRGAAIKLIFSGVKAKINQRAEGKYDVIGQDDGRTYNQVPYRGQMGTGIYARPTLVGERGDELVVDNKTLRNVRFNFPDVLPKIKASMVAQRADGNVSELERKIPSQSSSTHSDAAINSLSAVVRSLSAQLKSGLPAKISFEHFKNQTRKAESIIISSNRK